MESRMTKAVTDYSSRAKTGRTCLRSKWKAASARVGSIFLRRLAWVKAELEWFAEGFLRIVMLVALPLVELVGALANHVGAHVHGATAAPARPVLGSFQQLGAGAQAAMGFRDDQAIDLGSHIALQQIRNAHMDPAHYVRAWSFGDEHCVL